MITFCRLQSDTCAVRIPELELELEEGTLGGQFTTIEGLLTQVKEQVLTTHTADITVNVKTLDASYLVYYG